MDNFRKLLGQMTMVINQMSPSQKATIIMFFTVIVISIMILMRVGSSTEYRPIMSVSDSRAKAIEKMLDENGIENHLQGEKLVIPDKDVARVTMMLASENLLPAGRDLFESVLSDKSLSTTKQQRSMQYREALGKELSRILGTMDHIAFATVRLTAEKSNTFLTITPPVTASVTIRPASSGRLTDEQVNAIVSMVAYAVKDLKPEHVSVVDTRGHSYKQDSTFGSGASSLYKLQRQVEAYFQGKILVLLASIQPYASAVVTVELDQEKLKSTLHLYDPKGTGGFVSEAETEKSNSKSAEPNGEVFTSDIRGDVESGGQASQESKTQRTDTKYIFSNVIDQIERHPGKITKRSVAITLPHRLIAVPSGQAEETGISNTEKPFNATEVSEVENGIRAAIGMLDSEKVAIVRVGNPAEALRFKEEDDTSFKGTLRSIVASHGKDLGLGFFILIILLVMRGVLKRAATQIKDDVIIESASGLPSVNEPDIMTPEGEALQKEVTKMVMEDPETAGRVLSKWINK